MLFLQKYIGINISTTIIGGSINPPSPSFKLGPGRDMSVTHLILLSRKVLLFWASWLQLVGELQQKNVFPRLTESAVTGSEQNLHLIKNAAQLSLADSRAGLVSFELGCRSLTVT